MSHKKLYSYFGTSWTLMIKEFSLVAPEWSTFMVAGQEFGSDNKEHVQFYCQSHWTRKRIMKKYGFHVENLISRKSADKYCQKENKEIYKFGEWKECEQGKRSDLAMMMEDIKNGATEDMIMDAYPANYLRYRNHIISIINRARAARFPIRRAAPRKVIFFYGPSGSGKTKRVFDEIGDKPFYRLANQDNTMWWPGYEGQDIVVLDDFKGGMKLNTLLGILDPWYNTDVSIRPGQLTRMTASTIYITSTQCLAQWYLGQDVKEVERRITECISILK